MTFFDFKTKINLKKKKRFFLKKFICFIRIIKIKALSILNKDYFQSYSFSLRFVILCCKVYQIMALLYRDLISLICFDY